MCDNIDLDQSIRAKRRKYKHDREQQYKARFPPDAAPGILGAKTLCLVTLVRSRYPKASTWKLLPGARKIYGSPLKSSMRMTAGKVLSSNLKGGRIRLTLS